MISLVLYYFSTLAKRILVLLLFCSFILWILLAHNYTWDQSFSIFRDTVLLSIPWFLWFHQAFYSGFLAPHKTSIQLTSILVGAFLSSVILMIGFPYTQHDLPLEIEKLRPNIVAPRGPIVTSPAGTLILNPREGIHEMFSLPTSSALWITSNYILFDEIETNTHSFSLKKPHSFSEFGYYPQQGVLVLPYDNSYPSFPQYSLGQYVIQTWFDNMLDLNTQIANIYKALEMPLPQQTNKYFNQLLIKKEARTNRVPRVQDDVLQVFHDKTTETQEKILKKDTLKRISRENKIKLVDYLSIFISLLCIFTFASLLGILLTLRQHLLGAIVLILVSSLYVPSYSSYTMSASLELQKVLPQYSFLIIHTLIFGILCVCCLVAYTLKIILKEKQHP